MFWYLPIFLYRAFIGDYPIWIFLTFIFLVTTVLRRIYIKQIQCLINNHMFKLLTLCILKSYNATMYDISMQPYIM